MLFNVASFEKILQILHFSTFFQRKNRYNQSESIGVVFYRFFRLSVILLFF